jgi:acetoin utilization deacetylase AcuC-like enzyme
LNPLLAIVYSKKFLEHKTGIHCENPLRLEVSLDALRRFSLINDEKCIVVEPRMASVEELKLVHDEDYVEEIRNFCLSGGGYYDGDTYLSRESFDVASYAVGGMLNALEEVFKGNFKRLFGLVRPPGHHAGVYGRAMGASTVGFCVFNNVAVLAAYALKKGLAKKILIFDFDVHHGNGTQEIFNRSAKVLYISFHEKGIYPGTGYEFEVGEGEGEGFSVNVPMPHRSDNKIYLKAMEEIVIPIGEEFKPDLVLLSAGFDAHHSDNISSIQLSAESYFQMTEFMVKLSKKYSDGRVLACLEGGYSRETLSKSLPATIAALNETRVDVKDSILQASTSIVDKAEETIRTVKKIQSKYWKI